MWSEFGKKENNSGVFEPFDEISTNAAELIYPCNSITKNYMVLGQSTYTAICVPRTTPNSDLYEMESVPANCFVRVTRFIFF